jgi:ABC-2 type transport system permease protein
MNQWHVLVGVVSSLLVFGAGVMLGAQFVWSGVGLAILIALLGVISAAAVGITSAAVLLLTLKSAPVLRLYNMASSILAGSIFAVDQLPDWLQPFSYLLPHTYVINGIRSVLMPDPGSFDMPASTAIIALSVFDVLVFPLAMWLFTRALTYSRKIGGLGAY